VTFWEKLLSNPDFHASVISALLGLLTLGGIRLNRRVTELKAVHEETKTGVERAATAAEAASVQVNNTHETNLRDDLDDVREALSRVEFSIDESEARAQVWRSEHGAAHEKEREARERVEARADAQMDMLRRDVQDLSGRVDALREASVTEHERLHARINNLKKSKLL
jgi:hypothetical protein